jgi:hypothetical protein
MRVGGTATSDDLDRVRGHPNIDLSEILLKLFFQRAEELTVLGLILNIDEQA